DRGQKRAGRRIGDVEQSGTALAPLTGDDHTVAGVQGREISHGSSVGPPGYAVQCPFPMNNMPLGHDDRMDLHTLRYFVAVADTGTVSAAAEVVRVTQPSLSRQLRGLERDLGVALFERGHGRLTLSPAGRQLLPRVRDLLTRADDLRTAA